jgi:transposase-like protein
VDAEAKRILGRMTDATLNRWYRAYQETKRTRKRPKAVGE